MNNLNRIAEIDGLPGVIIPGYKGVGGDRGNTTIFTTEAESGDSKKLSLKINGEKVAVSGESPKGFQPIENDFIFHRDNGKILLYVIETAESTTEDNIDYECVCTLIDTWTENAALTSGDSDDFDVVVTVTERTLTYLSWDGTNAKITEATKNISNYGN